MFSREKLKGIPFAAIVIALVAIVAVIIAVVSQGGSNQAEEAIIPDIVLCGEYRISDGDWQPIENAGHISSTDGNVELKGVFRLYYPQTGEDLGAVEGGTVISLYLDHLKATIKDSNGNVWVSDNENELIGKGSCTKKWSEYVFEGETGAEVYVTIYNPHVFGNEMAVDRLLGSFGIYIEGGNSGLIADMSATELTALILLIAFLFILFGVSLLLSVIRSKHSGEIWLLWLLVLFGGIYFIFSRENIAIWNPMHAFNTMMLGSSMMLYIFTAYALVSSIISGKFKKIATTSTVILGATSLISIISSLRPTVKFYNTYPYWTIVAVCTAVVLIACLVADTFSREKKSTKKYIYITSIAVLLIFIIDVIATFVGAWQGGRLSIIALVAIVITAIVVMGRVVPKSIRTVLEAKSIEAERQAMELKLQESHISIMLSQIQPHFLYNTLNSIYHLCETNPMRAKYMVNSFSEYLRNNLSSLEETGLISFETELSHITTYLDIEKVRFEDTLEIEYDVQCSDFSLPVLTVQPIVENAVKHGTSKKRGGGKVIISTLEDKENYIIKVSDTGCGFDPTKPKNDGKRHVGIENVKQRLSNMCGGSLTIESEVGVGTVATIRIPKGDKK